MTTPTAFVRYDYNAFGLLVRKWTSRTAPTPDRHFLWDQGHLALELDGALNTRIGEYAYLPGTDRPLAFITNSITGRGVRVLYQDSQGSVMGLVGTDGALLASQKSSDPWGVTSTWSVGLVMPDTMRLGWQGLMAERAPVNLYYARARWYDPLTKRFLSPDPLGVSAGVNRYLFAGGDPMNMADPFGLDDDRPACRWVETTVTSWLGGFSYKSIETAWVCDTGGRSIPELPTGSYWTGKLGTLPPPASSLPRTCLESASPEVGAYFGAGGLVGGGAVIGSLFGGLDLYGGYTNNGTLFATVQGSASVGVGPFYVGGGREAGAIMNRTPIVQPGAWWSVTSSTGAMFTANFG